MMVDEDYMNFMSDTLFSTITSNQPFAFPDTREIGKKILTILSLVKVGRLTLVGVRCEYQEGIHGVSHKF